VAKRQEHNLSRFARFQMKRKGIIWSKFPDTETLMCELKVSYACSELNSHSLELSIVAQFGEMTHVNESGKQAFQVWKEIYNDIIATKEPSSLFLVRLSLSVIC
jgi:hypothetical protein